MKQFMIIAALFIGVVIAWTLFMINPVISIAVLVAAALIGMAKARA